jgi:PAS domain S-box-containing protein
MMEVRRNNDVLEHALLNAWLEVSDMGLCVLDDKARVVMLNQAACGLLEVDGVAAFDLPLAQVLQHLHLKPSVLLLMETEGFDGERQATIAKNDAIHHLLLKFRSVRVGDSARFKMLSITDVSEVVKAQVELADQRRLWESMNAGVVISDARKPDMPVVYINSFFEKMSGYTQVDMVGRNCRHLQGTDTQQPGLSVIRDAIRLETNGYAVLRNYRKDGSLFVNELFVSPIKNEHGVTTHFMGIQHLRDKNFKLAGELPA